MYAIITQYPQLVATRHLDYFNFKEYFMLHTAQLLHHGLDRR